MGVALTEGYFGGERRHELTASTLPGRINRTLENLYRDLISKADPEVALSVAEIEAAVTMWSPVISTVNQVEAQLQDQNSPLHDFFIDARELMSQQSSVPSALREYSPEQLELDGFTLLTKHYFELIGGGDQSQLELFSNVLEALYLRQDEILGLLPKSDPKFTVTTAAIELKRGLMNALVKPEDLDSRHDWILAFMSPIAPDWSTEGVTSSQKAVLIIMVALMCGIGIAAIADLNRDGLLNSLFPTPDDNEIPQAYSQTQQGCTIAPDGPIATYVVQPNDNLSSIGRGLGFTGEGVTAFVKEVVILNSLTNPDSIEVGTPLSIPTCLTIPQAEVLPTPTPTPTIQPIPQATELIQQDAVLAQGDQPAAEGLEDGSYMVYTVSALVDQYMDDNYSEFPDDVREQLRTQLLLGIEVKDSEDRGYGNLFSNEFLEETVNSAERAVLNYLGYTDQFLEEHDNRIREYLSQDTFKLGIFNRQIGLELIQEQFHRELLRLGRPEAGNHTANANSAFNRAIDAVMPDLNQLIASSQRARYSLCGVGILISLVLAGAILQKDGLFIRLLDGISRPFQGRKK